MINNIKTFAKGGIATATVGPPPGAFVCSGLLDLRDFAGDMERLGMEHWASGDGSPAKRVSNLAA